MDGASIYTPTLSTNSAETYGGGITNTANLTITSSTLSGNTVGAGAGAVYNLGTLTVTDSTIAGNSTADRTSYYYNAGGITNSGTATIDGSIVAGNTVAGNTGGDVSGTYTGNDNLIGVNPMLAALGNYGGPTQTMPPLPGSLALGEGGNFTDPISGDAISTDQRGFPLPSTPDMGAFQTNPITVNTLASDPVGTDQMSFTDATNLANAYGGSQSIGIDPSIITESNGTLSVGNVFSITAPVAVDEGSSATLTFNSGSALAITGWSVAGTDQNNNELFDSGTMLGTSGTYNSPDVTTAALFATVSAYESLSNSYVSFVLPAIETGVVPYTPIGLTASVVSPTEIALNWSDPTTAATEYDLSEYIGGAWVPLDTVATSQTYYNVTGLTAGTSYSFEVAASAYGNDSSLSSASATTATPPVVTAMGDATVAENGTYTLNLTADSSAARSNSVAGWNINWGNGPIYYSGANLTETIIVPTGYHGLAIIASVVTNATSSVPSYSVQADPVYVNVVPIAPSSVSASLFSSSGITIDWQDTSQSDSTVILLRSDDGGSTFLPIMYFGPGSGTYNDTGLAPDTTYSYEVETEGGLDGQTTSGTFTDPVTLYPTEFGLTLTPGFFDTDGGTINATWNYTGTDINNWELEYEDATAGTNYQLSVSDPAQRSASINAIPGDTYSVRLRADYTDGLVSDWETQTEALTSTLFPTITVRQDPSNTESDPNLTNVVDVSWALPEGVGDPSVSIEYRGSCTGGNGWEPLDTGSDPIGDGWYYLDRDMPVQINIGDGQTAVFRVEMNGVDMGGWGYSQSITQEGTPGNNPTVSLQLNGNDTVTANWSGADALGSYCVSYAQQAYDQPAVACGNSFALPQQFTTGNTYTYGIQPGDHLFVLIELVDPTELPDDEIIQNAPGYAEADIVVPGAPLPASPSNLVATLTKPTQVFLHWFNNSNDESAFDIYRSDDPSFDTDVSLIQSTGADVNQYTDTLPNETTTYYYRVYAYSDLAADDGDGLVADEILAGESSEYAGGTQGGMALQSVLFGGGAIQVGTSWEQTPGMIQPISRDNGSGTYPTGQPEWLDTNLNGTIDAPGFTPYLDGTIAPQNSSGALITNAEHTWPISYERSLPSQAAYMDATPFFAFFGSMKGNWEVQGNSSDSGGESFTFGPVALEQVPGGLTALVPSDEPLPQTIESQSLTITWRISMDGGNSWNTVPVGISKNHLFVTGASAQNAFETVLYVGCQGANGLAPHNAGDNNNPTNSFLIGQASYEDEKVLNAIFNNEFTSLKLYTVEDNLLTYWGSHFGLGRVWPVDRNTSPWWILLEYNDARCGEWAQFFEATAACEGVTTSDKDLQMSFTHRVPANPDPGQHGDLTGFYTPEKAQGGVVPTEQWFNDHVIVEYIAGNGSCLVFDPSYGVNASGQTVVLAELAWGAQAIAAGVKGDWVKEGGLVQDPSTLDWYYTGFVQGSALFPIVPMDFDFNPQ